MLTPNSDAGLGRGYAWLAAAQLLIDRPDAKLKFFNRGNSGNKVYQLAERWQADCLDLKPDVLSILIGVNDFSHSLDGSYKSTAETYESGYRALIKRTKAALPNVKLVICEPFVLKAGKVNDKWFPGYDGYRAAAKRVADESGAVFVPFQTMFDAAVEDRAARVVGGRRDSSNRRRRGDHGELMAQICWSCLTAFHGSQGCSGDSLSPWRTEKYSPNRRNISSTAQLQAIALGARSGRWLCLKLRIVSCLRV